MIQQIDKYRIKRLIGQGRTAAVYEAYDPGLDRVVVVKVLHEAYGKTPALRKQFYEEGRLSAKLDHENITTTFEIGEDQGRLFLVKEYLTGVDLRTYIDRQHPLSLRRKLDWLLQLAEALQYAHANQVLHGNLSPTNIRIEEDGVLKVMDIGVAPLAMRIKQEHLAEAPPYMSPEQLQKKLFDARSDIFSFGIIAYELLTGRHPFMAPTPLRMVEKVQHAAVPPLVLATPDLSRAVQQILFRCLEKESTRRYPSMRGIIQDLQHLEVVYDLKTGEKKSDIPTEVILDPQDSPPKFLMFFLLFSITTIVLLLLILYIVRAF